jgi:hypothetical protein
MDIKAYEKALLMAQNISFAYEDLFGDVERRKLFEAIFEQFLNPVDPEGKLEPHDAMVALWRKSPDDFDHMVRELEESSLIEI